jgi:prophage antirepressor-like protein
MTKKSIFGICGAKADAVTPYTFPVTGQNVRVVKIAGEPMFVAADVCDALGFSHTPSAIRALDEDEKGVLNSHTLGGTQEMSIISESGLFSLILKSRKPEAKAFKKWVTHDVLPAIRKDGGYILGEEKVKTGELEEAQFHFNALTMLEIKAARLSEENAQLISENTALEYENEQIRPMAEKYLDFMDSKGGLTITEAGKSIGISGYALARFLRSQKWIFSRTDRIIPMQQALDNDVMRISISRSPSGYVTTRALITPIGLDVLIEMFAIGVAA